MRLTIIEFQLFKHVGRFTILNLNEATQKIVSATTAVISTQEPMFQHDEFEAIKQLSRASVLVTADDVLASYLWIFQEIWSVLRKTSSDKTYSLSKQHLDTKKTQRSRGCNTIFGAHWVW